MRRTYHHRDILSRFKRWKKRKLVFLPFLWHVDARRKGERKTNWENEPLKRLLRSDEADKAVSLGRFVVFNHTLLWLEVPHKSWLKLVQYSMIWENESVIRVPIEIKGPQNDHSLTTLSPIFKRIPFICIILEHSGKKNN